MRVYNSLPAENMDLQNILLSVMIGGSAVIGADSIVTKSISANVVACGDLCTVKKMIENDTYCTDVLIQVSAVNAALNSFNKVLLANHIRTCVAEDIREGKDETIDELVKVLQKLMK